MGVHVGLLRVIPSCTVKRVTAAQDDVMTAAAIARLAGVGRAAVSNWRARYQDFPEPISETGKSPLFSRAEVEAWLVATGKANQLATAGRTATGTQVLDRAAARQIRDAGIADFSQGQLLVRVMVSLIPEWEDQAESEPPTLLDPYCRDGSMLVSAADRFGSRVHLAGQGASESAAAEAALSLREHPQNLSYEPIRVGDSLLDNQLSEYLGTAAAVVCLPPLDAPRWPAGELIDDPRWVFGVPEPRDGELAWIQHCYAHLRRGGTAVVAMTPRAAVQPSGQPIRTALVKSGVLRDVISLPKELSPLPGTGLHLWVLQRPRDTPSTAVSMIDLSHVNPADVPHDPDGWKLLFTSPDPAIAQAIPRSELLDPGCELLPSHHMTIRSEVTANDLARVTDRLQALYVQAAQTLPRFAAGRASALSTSVTLAELERSGALRIRSRDTTPRQGDLLVRTLGRPPVVATGTSADDTGIAQVVELDTSRLDPHFVAVFLRADAAALPIANTLGALSRDDLRRCRIPRMSLAEQRRYGDAFRHLDELDTMLGALAKVSTSVIAQTVHGLTTGSLTPNPPKTNDPTMTESETNQP